MAIKVTLLVMLAAVSTAIKVDPRTGQTQEELQMLLTNQQTQGDGPQSNTNQQRQQVVAHQARAYITQFPVTSQSTSNQARVQNIESNPTPSFHYQQIAQQEDAQQYATRQQYQPQTKKQTPYSVPTQTYKKFVITSLPETHQYQQQEQQVQQVQQVQQQQQEQSERRQQQQSQYTHQFLSQAQKKYATASIPQIPEHHHQQQYQPQQPQYSHQSLQNQHQHQQQHHQHQQEQELEEVDYYQPAHYTFHYGVDDAHTGDSKEHKETRDGDKVEGYYTLKQADGTRRIVQYTADHHNGFNAIVRYEGTPVVAPHHAVQHESAQPPAYEHLVAQETPKYY